MQDFNFLLDYTPCKQLSFQLFPNLADSSACFLDELAQRVMDAMAKLLGLFIAVAVPFGPYRFWGVG